MSTFTSLLFFSISGRALMKMWNPLYGSRFLLKIQGQSPHRVPLWHRKTQGMGHGKGQDLMTPLCKYRGNMYKLARETLVDKEHPHATTLSTPIFTIQANARNTYLPLIGTPNFPFRVLRNMGCVPILTSHKQYYVTNPNFATPLSPNTLDIND